MRYEAAIGYMIRSMELLKYSSIEIKNAKKTMQNVIDLINEEQAEEIYRNFLT